MSRDQLGFCSIASRTAILVEIRGVFCRTGSATGTDGYFSGYQPRISDKCIFARGGECSLQGFGNHQQLQAEIDPNLGDPAERMQAGLGENLIEQRDGEGSFVHGFPRIPLPSP